jgi:phage/plasmid-like protein (TIGR03299 family)
MIFRGRRNEYLNHVDQFFAVMVMVRAKVMVRVKVRVKVRVRVRVKVRVRVRVKVRVMVRVKVRVMVRVEITQRRRTMSHEIEEHDDVVLHGKKAWHGLGIVVEEAPTPLHALDVAGLDWEVEQWSLTARAPGFLSSEEERKTIDLEDSVLNVRSDVRHPLGIVGKGYTPIQNRELAEFAEALAEQDDVVKVESAGSIRNGAKVWFLLKGESFSVRDKDEVKPYILLSNGHDGGTALRATPTTIRVVCSNTLHMVIPDKDESGAVGRMSDAGFSCYHTGDVKKKVELAKQALKLYGHRLEENKAVIDELATKQMDSEAIRKFFLDCYIRDFGPVPDVAVTKQEKRRRESAMDGWSKVKRRWEVDMDLTGSTAWGALNAYTGWLQHDRSWLKDPMKREERRIHSALFGTSAQRGTETLKTALALGG